VLALKIGSGIEAQVRWPESPGLPQGTAFDRTAPCTAGDKQVRQGGFDQTAIPLSPGGFRTPQRKFDRWHRSRPDWIFSSIYNHQQMLDFHPHNHSMLRFIKYSRYSDRFDIIAPPLPVRQSSYEERLEALTVVYLELSLPLQKALQAAEADLRQLDVETCAMACSSLAG